MVDIETERVTAEVDDPFVVFLIGMRINAFWQVHKWLPVFLAMPRMLAELEEQEESGLLGYRTRWGIRNVEVIQYWRSFDHLRDYAREPDAEHLPAWSDFNRDIGGDGSVGIWHETYVVDPDRYEAVYRNMPSYGLAEATQTVSATGDRKTAAGRLGRTSDDKMPTKAADGE